MGVPEVVYHASRARGLKLIKPRRSTHGKWVYATVDPVMAACFLSGRGGDFTCAVGRDPGTGKPYICERFAGAFEHRYAGVAGSIYRLPGAGFLEGRTPWPEEVVCPHPVVPLGEEPVDDAAAYLRRLAGEGKLLIVRYPHRIAGIPEDDEDLVAKAVVWARKFGPMGWLVFRELKRYHPHLLERARRALRGGKYTEEDLTRF